MGHRCNYVVRERGEITLYYSHWGALGVPRDWFWGLAAARGFLAGHEPCKPDGWVDDVFGEGGAALDLDTRTLTINGGEIYGPARDLLVVLMRVVWARDGFRVHDAASFVEIATAVGLPASSVEAEHLADTALDVDDPDASGREEGYMSTLVVVDGALRFTRSNATAVVEMGAPHVHELGRLPDLAEALELWASKPAAPWESEKSSFVDRLSEAIVIDTRALRLELDAYQVRRSTSRRHYEALWQGFAIAGHGGLRAVLSRVNHPELVLPPEPAPPTLAEQLAQIESYLFSTRSDPAEWMASLQAREPDSWVNPHALISPGDGRPSDAPLANTLFRAVVAEVLAKRAP
ncbi:MAG: hypothetical protein M4D80_34755 [Myxococcota bacterium]|nr:hypothetical protein [Deltaproteobacteria bacterium]MDQ3340349.1 hypothetical protein [Myxococcota bacterium]